MSLGAQLCSINTPKRLRVYAQFEVPLDRPRREGTAYKRNRARARVACGRAGNGRGRAHARADRRLDAPERHWVTYQCRRVEADPGSLVCRRVPNPCGSVEEARSRRKRRSRISRRGCRSSGRIRYQAPACPSPPPPAPCGI